MYQFLLFDADKTLFDFDRSEHAAFSQTAADFRLPDTPEAYEAYHHINDALWKDFENNLIDKPSLMVERFRRLCGILGCADANAAAINECYKVHLARSCILLPGAEALCRTLSGRFSLYLVSNGERSVPGNRYDTAPIRPYFSELFVSEDVGAAKPSRQYFDYVAAHIPGFDRRNALIIGDSLTSDIRGGVNAGIDTCFFNPRALPVPASIQPTYTISRLDELTALPGIAEAFA